MSLAHLRRFAGPGRGSHLARTVAIAVIAYLAVILLVNCQKKSEPFEILQPPPESFSLQRFWPVPDFVLRERNGAKVTLAELRGKVWVTDFFYTTCPGPCPLMTSRLSEVHRATSDFDDVRLISITIDPEKDTPALLQEYAKQFGANERWLFLTGNKESIFRLATSGFKLAVAETGTASNEPIIHSTKLVLVDKNAMVRGFYEGTTPTETKRLVQDIERLRSESR